MKSVLNVFISLPMGGCEKTDIMERWSQAVEKLVDRYKDENGGLVCDKICVVDSMFESAFDDSFHPLAALGESLKKMASADVVDFCKGWEEARGCRIEHDAAVAYGLDILYEDDEGETE